MKAVHKLEEADEPAQAMQTPLQHRLQHRWLACSCRPPRLCSGEEVAGVSSADPNCESAHWRGVDIKNRNTCTPRRTPRLYSPVRCTGICTHFSQRREAFRERGRSVSCRTPVPIAARFSCSWIRATPRMISNCQRLSRSVNTLMTTRELGLLENGQMASGEERLEGKWLVH